MRQYELVAVLNSEEDQFKAGKQAVADLLAQYKAIDVKEDDMGDRPLAYPIKKKARAHGLFSAYHRHQAGRGP